MMDDGDDDDDDDDDGYQQICISSYLYITSLQGRVP